MEVRLLVREGSWEAEMLDGHRGLPSSVGALTS